MRILNVVGARPNLVKIAPLLEAQRAAGSIEPVLCHTGQHYDEGLSGVFFRELKIPPPDIQLDVGSGTHAEQTAAVLVGVERAIVERRPDLVLVVGDVNSTLAAALAAVKLGVPIAHVEAGLRSRDPSMPEEWNRILTDRVSTWLFTTSIDANENLIREGIARERIHFTGNVMVDTLLRHQSAAEAEYAKEAFADVRYGIVTLHRPGNVDDDAALPELWSTLTRLAEDLPLIFPCHPRTRRRLASLGFDQQRDTHIMLRDPLGYHKFIGLLASASLVLTDSGGVQEETTVLGVPCLTLRENTERPVTVRVGTNLVVGRDPTRILEAAHRVLADGPPARRVPDLWDGHAADRIVRILAAYQPPPAR